MSDSRVMGGLERLPWLADEPVRKSAPVNQPGRNLMAWAAGAVVLVAGLSFWLGTRAPTEQTFPIPARTSATVAVPAARSAPVPQAQVTPPPQPGPVEAPQIRLVRVPEVRIVPVPVPAVPAAPDTSAPPQQFPSSDDKATATNETPVAPNPVVVAPLRPWQPRVVAGAAGRIVQVGAFGSVPQAKLGWRYMVRTYPAVAHLPAVVRPDRNSKGRVFYRFRVGTTSQAHSEVLCQRMEKIGLSCAVVGLPWKAKVER